MRKCSVSIVYQRNEGSLAACAGRTKPASARSAMRSARTEKRVRRVIRLGGNEHGAACVAARYADRFVVVGRDDRRVGRVNANFGDEAFEIDPRKEMKPALERREERIVMR